LGPLRELYRDHAVYAGAFVKTFLESYVEEDAFFASLTIDGRSLNLSGLTDLVLKATRVFAGSWVLDRSGEHDDGKFELCPFIGKNDWASKAIVSLEGIPIAEQDLKSLGVEHSKNHQGSHFSLRLRPAGSVPVYAQIDGEEYVTADRYDIEVIQGALRLIVP
jgi:diacylglycerol kinase family enzyme